MGDAARKNGTPIGSWSAYRSYDQQVALFNGYVKAYGYDNAKEFSQRPGHSEHQLGLVIDFMASGANGMLSGSSATGKWMAANSWKYGWILSYPPSKTDPSHLWNQTVCFRYEAWHYRYFGRDLAKKIHDSGLTVREYLWENYTTVDVTTGRPLPSPTAGNAPTPTSSASPGATATLSAVGGSPPATPATPTATGAVASTGVGTWLLIAFLAVAGAVLLGIAALGVGGRRRLLGRGAGRR
jgi:D-alanyl-D-alanine carboxypeptidase